MTETPFQMQTPIGSPPPPRPPLRRSLADRKVAGVCGGLGRQLALDPLIFRILLAVLTFAGGAGVLLYALAWLLIPEDAQAESDGEKLIHGRADAGSAAVVVVLLIGLGVSGGFLFGRPSSTLAALVIIGVIGALLLARRDPARAVAGYQPVSGTGYQEQPGTVWSGYQSEPTAPSSGYQPPAYQQPYGPVYGPGTGTAYAPRPAYGPPPPPGLPRERSWLGLIVLSVGLLTGAALVTADLLGASIGPRVVLASILLVLGLGMVLGAFVGRALWLLIVAIPLSLALGLVAAVEPTVGAGTGSPVWAPAGTLSADLTYRLGAGDAVLDLTDIDISAPTALGTHNVDVQVGAGRLLILVPAGLDVQVELRSTIGQVVWPNGLDDGVVVEHTWAQGNPDNPRIVIDAQTTFGEVEVRNAQA